MTKTVARLDHEVKPFCPTRVFPSLERAIVQLDPFQDPPNDDRLPECNGHPAGPFDPMGQTVYCDGSCRS